MRTQVKRLVVLGIALLAGLAGFADGKERGWSARLEPARIIPFEPSILTTKWTNETGQPIEMLMTYGVNQHSLEVRVVRVTGEDLEFQLRSDRKGACTAVVAPGEEVRGAYNLGDYFDLSREGEYIVDVAFREPAGLRGRCESDGQSATVGQNFEDRWQFRLLISAPTDERDRTAVALLEKLRSREKTVGTAGDTLAGGSREVLELGAPSFHDAAATRAIRRQVRVPELHRKGPEGAKQLLQGIKSEYWRSEALSYLGSGYLALGSWDELLGVMAEMRKPGVHQPLDDIWWSARQKALARQGTVGH